MPTFPTGVKLGWRDSNEAPRPIVERSEMDRGIPKQRVIAADTLVKVPLTLYFDTAAAATDFETWFYSDGLSWFDFTLPRTGAVVQARIVGGKLGPLVPKTGNWAYSSRQIELEYVKPVL